MPTPDSIAETFRDLNFHDFTFVDLRVLPAQRRGDAGGSAVEIRLRQYSEKKLHSVRFSGCRNLRVAMDFDVLAGNLPPNTSRVDAHTDLNRIRDLMQSQEKDWDVGYGSGVESPLIKKFAEIDHLIAFRVQFFGGAIDVIAHEYAIQAL
jgi:hypothetical protein